MPRAAVDVARVRAARRATVKLAPELVDALVRGGTYRTPPSQKRDSFTRTRWLGYSGCAARARPGVPS